MTANNDALIRVFDAKSFACVDNFSFPWSVNVSISYLYCMKFINKMRDVALWADLGVDCLLSSFGTKWVQLC